MPISAIATWAILACSLSKSRMEKIYKMTATRQVLEPPPFY
jgi:hypothetical protein